MDRRLSGVGRAAGLPGGNHNLIGLPVRGFASLLFAVALAAHLGPAEAPSLGIPASCADEVGAGALAGDPVLFPAAALGATQAATADGRERSSGNVGRRATPLSAGDVRRPLSAGSATSRVVCVPSSLLGLPGNPTTAPPLQA